MHSNQGFQCNRRAWQMFLHQHDLEPGLSRHGDCHDNAVAESFFQQPKRGRVKRRTYTTGDAARQAAFEYIEQFHNPNRRHTNKGMLSPVDFEIRPLNTKLAGVWETRGTSVCTSPFFSPHPATLLIVIWGYATAPRTHPTPIGGLWRTRVSNQIPPKCRRTPLFGLSAPREAYCNFVQQGVVIPRSFAPQ